jgi:hypothetical protein
MLVSIVTGGLLGHGIALGGLVQGTSTPLVCYVDARSVQLIAADSDADPFGVDARSAQLISIDSDLLAVDPRAGQLIS